MTGSGSKTLGKTIVIKLGTSSIVSPTYPYTPLLSLLSTLTELINTLMSPPHSHRVILVSSGAIGVGLRRMDLRERGKGLGRKQALAAVGQGRLIAMWDGLFGMVGRAIGQVLLTRQDISDRQRYINAQNTFTHLLALGVVPIVNENDTVSVSEIKFGDNDTLSAITASMVGADWLFLVTDVECLYTDNPRKNPEAKPVRVVHDIAKVREEVSTSTLGTSLGTGGMSTKLIAAELAVAAGVETIILSSSNVKDIMQIIEHSAANRRSEHASGSGSGEGLGLGSGETASEERDVEGMPICTRFLSRHRRMNDRKWWIAHGLHAAGTVVIDEGAYRGVQRKESGGRLLPAGVVRVEGTFASHQAVRLIVRRRKRQRNISQGTSASGRYIETEHETTTPPGDSTPDGAVTPAGTSTPISPDAVAGSLSRMESPQSNVHFTAPGTPNIGPVLSLSSSIASLDTLSLTGGRSVPQSPATFAKLLLRQATDGHEFPSHQHEPQEEEYEEVVIGKGLAQYNSVEIDRLKGLKSSDIATVLGYSEAAHVVDSIVFTE